MKADWGDPPRRDWLPTRVQAFVWGVIVGGWASVIVAVLAIRGAG